MVIVVARMVASHRADLDKRNRLPCLQGNMRCGGYQWWGVGGDSLFYSIMLQMHELQLCEFCVRRVRR